jgi:hypothetical protein
LRTWKDEDDLEEEEIEELLVKKTTAKEVAQEELDREFYQFIDEMENDLNNLQLLVTLEEVRFVIK